MLQNLIQNLQSDETLLRYVMIGVAALSVVTLLVGIYRRKTQLEAVIKRADELEAVLKSANDEITERSAQTDDLRRVLKEASEALVAHREAERHLRERVPALEAELAETRAKNAQLGSDAARLTEALTQERKAGAEKLALLQANGESLKAEFKALAGEALKQQGDDFAKTNREKLDLLLKPLQEHIGKFQLELRHVHTEAGKDRAKLGAEIDALTKRSAEMSKEAGELTKALKGDTQRQGAWGEMVLARILENSGLREGQEYETQAHQRSEDGRALRPDVIVRLPGGKRLVVDSKVSLVAYDEAVNAADEGVRAAALKRHVASIKKHIDLLASKEYHHLDDGAVDYVILFIPIEGALAEALRENGSLTTYAAECAVMIATPTTLMMSLRTIENVWSGEKRNRNAEEIAKRAGLMYDKMKGFVEDMHKVGDQLNRARSSHQAAVDKLSIGRGNLIGQFEVMKQLGARTTKEIGVDHDDVLPALEGENDDET